MKDLEAKPDARFAPVVKTIEVSCSPDMAFEVFTARVGDWWPLQSHSSSVKDGSAGQTCVIEPRVGGAFYETRHDGTRDEWGIVKVWEPGRAFGCSWYPGTNKPAPTRVDVAFEATETGCKVTLTHTGWEAWGDKVDEVRPGYDGGWEAVFRDCYGKACEAA